MHAIVAETNAETSISTGSSSRARQTSDSNPSDFLSYFHQAPPALKTTNRFKSLPFRIARPELFFTTKKRRSYRKPSIVIPVISPPNHIGTNGAPVRLPIYLIGYPKRAADAVGTITLERQPNQRRLSAAITLKKEERSPGKTTTSRHAGNAIQDKIPFANCLKGLGFLA